MGKSRSQHDGVSHARMSESPDETGQAGQDRNPSCPLILLLETEKIVYVDLVESAGFYRPEKGGQGLEHTTLSCVVVTLRPSAKSSEHFSTVYLIRSDGSIDKRLLTCVS